MLREYYTTKPQAQLIGGEVPNVCQEREATNRCIVHLSTPLPTTKSCILEANLANIVIRIENFMLLQ